MQGIRDLINQFGLEGIVSFYKKEENRRYVETGTACIIKDEGWEREIIADKKGSRVTVVWNLWKETCRQIGDIPDEAYRSFVCVEAANVYADVVELQSGDHHTTSVVLGLKKQNICRK